MTGVPLGATGPNGTISAVDAHAAFALCMPALGGNTNAMVAGAKGDGATDDTLALNTMHAVSGDFVYPPGQYKVSGPIYVQPNTRIAFAPGAGMAPVPLAGFTELMFPGRGAFGYGIFVNANWQASVLTDTDITFEGPKCIVPGTNWNGHFLLMRMVQSLKIIRPYAQNMGDAVASLGCKDVLVDGGFASLMANCAWDFWEGPMDVTVRDSDAYDCVEGINFNAADTYLGLSLLGQNLRAIGNRFFRIASAGIFIAPLDAGSTLKNIECAGNYINQGGNPSGPSGSYQGIVSERAQNVSIHHNTIEALGTGAGAINCSTDLTVFGSDNHVDDNTVLNSAVGSATLISVYGPGAKARRNRAINSTGGVALAFNDASAVAEDNDLPGCTYNVINANPAGGATTPAGRRYYNAATGVWTYDQPILLPSGANPVPLKAYEEGTWIPALAFGGASAGIAYSTQSGTYTRIGRMWFVAGFIVLTAKGSSTGAATITGLPDGAVAGQSFRLGLSYYANMPSVTQDPALLISAGTIVIETPPVAGGGTAMTDANFSNATYLSFAGSFEGT